MTRAFRFIGKGRGQCFCHDGRCRRGPDVEGNVGLQQGPVEVKSDIDVFNLPSFRGAAQQGLHIRTGGMHGVQFDHALVGVAIPKQPSARFSHKLLSEQRTEGKSVLPLYNVKLTSQQHVVPVFQHKPEVATGAAHDVRIVHGVCHDGHLGTRAHFDVQVEGHAKLFHLRCHGGGRDGTPLQKPHRAVPAAFIAVCHGQFEVGGRICDDVAHDFDLVVPKKDVHGATRNQASVHRQIVVVFQIHDHEVVGHIYGGCVEVPIGELLVHEHTFNTCGRSMFVPQIKALQPHFISVHLKRTISTKRGAQAGHEHVQPFDLSLPANGGCRPRWLETQ